MIKKHYCFIILIFGIFLAMNSITAFADFNVPVSENIFNNHKSVMCIIDASSGAIVDVNHAAELFYGYSQNELIQMNISDINILSEAELIKNKTKVIYLFGFLIAILLMSLLIINHLKKNERDDKNKFKNLFKNMNDGFALHEIITDSKGRPVDYCFLDVNVAFEKIIGLKLEEIKNKTVKELFPLTEQYWIDSYGDVAINGKTISISNYSRELDKHFNVNVYRSSPNHFVTIFTDITFEKKAQEKIENEKKIIETILEDGYSGYWDWDLLNNTEYLSPSFKSMFGYKDDELENSPEAWQKIIYREDLPFILEKFDKHVATKGKEPFYNEVRYYHKNGSTIWVICSGRVIEWDGDKPLRMVGCHMNISKIKELESIITEEKKLFKTTLHSIGDGVISTDKNGNVNIMNTVAETLTGWTNTDAKDKQFQSIFNIINELTRNTCDNPVDKVFKTEEIIEIENHTLLINKNKEEIPIEDSAAPIRDENGNVIGVVVVFRDCTQKKERQKKIEYLSYHDQLTGLYNRHFFEQELKRLDVERNLPFTMAMVDVNGLKLTNDAFGHEAGDTLLKSVSKILKSECRTDDIISRVGGDEFVILLPKTNGDETELIVKRIYKAMGNEKVGNVIISVSIGWETKVNLQEDIKEIFSKAEDNMYRKKITETQSMRNETVKVIMQTLHETNQREKIHSEKVSQISRSIGEAMQLDSDTLKDLEIAALMHDIGKIAINSNILNKTEKLTEAEYDEIKRHSEIGYHILKSVDLYTSIAEYVLSHHERWDGKGYPRGLSGDEIPLISRIITVADSYEAMTANRLYKESFSHEQAIEELKLCSGTQFDPDVVYTFLKKI